MKPDMKHGIFLAVLAAGLYALSSPFSLSAEKLPGDRRLKHSLPEKNFPIQLR